MNLFDLETRTQKAQHSRNALVGGLAAGTGAAVVRKNVRRKVINNVGS